MNFYCNSHGDIFHIEGEKIYQGSAGVNTIRFIGRFPSSSQVMVKYELPNGAIRLPKLMTPVGELKDVVSPNDGGKYSVWETKFGAVLKLDDKGVIVRDSDGDPVYELDYSLTEYAGLVNVQFEVYPATSAVVVNGTVTNREAGKLATARDSFKIEEGVPAVEYNDLTGETAQTLVARILEIVSESTGRVKNVVGEVEQKLKDGEFKGEDGAPGPTGAKVISTVLVGETPNGDNIYKQTFDNFETAEFIAKRGAKGERGEKGDPGPTGARIISTEFAGLDSFGNINYKQTFDNGTVTEFTVLRGPQGITPHIGGNLNWWIGDEDTGVSAIGAMTFKILPVDELPSASDGIYIYALYLVKNKDSETGDSYTEYMYVNNKWEKIGTTSFSGIVQADIHIQDGNGVGSVEQIPDGVEDGFAFAEYNEDGSVKEYKNANAIENDTDLKELVDRGGKIPYGAFGHYTGAFGGNTSAQGSRAFAMNNKTIAKGDESVAQGYCSVALGGSSYAGGVKTTAVSESAHAEGTETVAVGIASHAEGIRTKTEYEGSHAEGIETKCRGVCTHAEGRNSVAVGDASHAEGLNTMSGKEYSHAEGARTLTVGVASHAEGEDSKTYGEAAHAEGINTEARGAGSHTEGEGTSTTDIASGAHAEGIRTVARGVGSHAEGIDTYAEGEDSHAEGANTHAIGLHSHAGGVDSSAEGYTSFVHGVMVHATHDYQTAIGIGNEDREDTLFEVGNSESGTPRSNAFAVTRDGRAKAKTAPRETDDVVRAGDFSIEIWTFTLENGDTVTKKVPLMGW